MGGQGGDRSRSRSASSRGTTASDSGAETSDGSEWSRISRSAGSGEAPVDESASSVLCNTESESDADVITSSEDQPIEGACSRDESASQGGVDDELVMNSLQAKADDTAACSGEGNTKNEGEAGAPDDSMTAQRGDGIYSVEWISEATCMLQHTTGASHRTQAVRSEVAGSSREDKPAGADAVSSPMHVRRRLLCQQWL